jgi:hypothetical protein
MDKNTCHTCGCEFKPEGIATGYGTDKDENRHCYACCENRESRAFEASDAYCCYLSSDGRTATTWTGGKLAAVTSERTTRAGYCGETVYVRATAPNGSRWYGRGGGRGMYLRLRRYKA